MKCRIYQDRLYFLITYFLGKTGDEELETFKVNLKTFCLIKT